MLGRWKRGVGDPSAREWVGLALEAEGFALCHVDRSAGERPLLRSADFVGCPEPEALGEILGEVAARRGLRGLPCVAVLPPKSYSVRLIDRPPVPDPELRDAARWAVREWIEIDPNEALVEVFPFPVRGPRGRDAQVFVVVADQTEVRRVELATRSAGLDLIAIDIRELALRNIVASASDAPGASALLQLGEKQSLLTICRDGSLFLARGLSCSVQTLDAGLEEDASDGATGPSLPEAVLDSVLLELQRSLDYFDSELTLGSVGRLLIAPADFETSLLVPYLSRNLSSRVESLDFRDFVDSDEILPQSLQARCLLALGAALHGDRPQPLELFRPTQDEPRGPLSLPAFARFAGATLLGLMAIGVHGDWQNQTQREGLAALRAQRDAQIGQLTSLRASMPAVTASSVLEREIRGLETERDARVQLLRALSTSGAGGTQGFSSALTGLSRRTVPDLWLTGIEIADGGRSLSLAGRTAEPERVPQLLQSLGQESVFEGIELRTVRLGAAEQGDGSVKFEVTTRSQEEPPQ